VKRWTTYSQGYLERKAYSRKARRAKLAQRFAPTLRDRLVNARLEREARLLAMVPSRSLTAARKRRRKAI
jgi:hypothetical protein